MAEAEQARDFDTQELARRGARAALARIAAERLCRRDCEFISVEIFDESMRPLTELRLVFREIPK